ncbi:hypothetical protein E0Z10_g6728 [Xylaria hypoxylon]|uniref:Protein kinase domain-containing protein n=1 Tax=Xylaria hypoxylon TaxID=37992 RepID=A0A4Z0YXC8_9PEZI|nr:hypothetical protein E0Z10_g6728 [Xylaria hypoxylon]
MSSSDLAPALSDSEKAGILIVTLDGLIVAADSRTLGFENLADENVRKGITASVTVQYKHQSVSFETLGGHLSRNNTVVWKPRDQRWRALNVSTPTELSVRLTGRNNNPLFATRFTPSWSTKLNLSLKSPSSSRQLVHLEAGRGTIFLRLCYTEQDLPPFEGNYEWEWPYPIGCTDLLRTQKRIGYHGVNQSYAMKVVENADTPAEFEISHPFIAPLQFSLRAPDKLRLFSPMAAGGYLFSHLQKHCRFNVFLARFFAAQLICVLEYLHDHGITFACLRPEYITVDAFDHISLCRPDIFILDPQKKENVLPGTPDITAPELLLGQDPSRATDWWSLGIFLYEMLTGLLPFYHKDPEQYRHRITSQELTVEASVSSDAVGILTRLLEKDPTKRLGVNGASEVKAHVFFQDIDWDELLPRPSVARFELCDTNMIFKSSNDSGVRCNIRKQIQISGIKYMEESFDVYRWWSVIGWVRNERSGNTTQSNIIQQDRNEWDVTWDASSKEFYLHNHTTDENRQVNEQTTNQKFRWPFTKAGNQPTVTDTDASTTMRAVPSELQKKYALATALEFGCKWAVEHGNTDLVNLFLGKGADASYTVEVKHGPALVKAVRKSDQQLVEILAKKTNRLSSTRTLRKAVALRDKAMVKTLLSAGVRCDFERADGAGIGLSVSDFSVGPASLGTSDYINPLAIAARAGDAVLVRLLLAHGADANADYHDFGSWVIEHDDGVERGSVCFSCARPVQVAMELGHSEVVGVLLEEGGADIWAPSPVSRFIDHKCAVVARNVYVRVTAGLEEAAAAMRLS